MPTIEITPEHITPQLRDRFEAKVSRSGGPGACHLWKAWTNSDGYGGFYIGSRATGLHTILAHRVSWVLEHGPIPPGLLVLHKCDKPPCVNPIHLFLGTVADNVADRESKGRGRRACGQSHVRAKLTDDQAKRLIAEYLALPRYPSGSVIRGSLKRLAEKYGLKRTTAAGIVSHRAWKHLDLPHSKRRRQPGNGSPRAEREPSQDQLA